MGRSVSLSRREVLTAVLLVSGAGVGIVGYSLYQNAANERAKQRIEESRVIASRGETVGIEGDEFEWTGTLGVTLLASRLYPSLSEAREAEDLGVVGEFDLQDGAYIVCDVELNSKDAHVEFAEDGVLNVTFLQLLYPNGETATSANSVWTSGEAADDEMAGIYGIRFGAGEVVTVRLGFSLPEGTDPEGSRLVYVSRQYQFLLGFDE